MASDAAAQTGLETDALLRALQEGGKPFIKVIVPSQEMECGEVQLVPGGGSNAGAGGQGRAEAGLGSPSCSRIPRQAAEAILGRLVTLGVDLPIVHTVGKSLEELY